MLASQGPSNAHRSPGAMTMAMHVAPLPVGVKRALRVGVVRSGKIIDERIFRGPAAVRVGSAEANDLMLEHASGVPRFTLFERASGQLFLRFSAEMQGRVGGAAGLASLDELRASGRASADRGGHRLRLDEHSRGKLVIGDTTLLFQMVVPPPITPKPALPASARGGFVAAIDWLFTACVVCAYAGLFGGVVYLENADWPLAMQNLSPDAVAEMIFTEPEPPAEPAVDRTPEPTSDPVATPTTEPPRERHATHRPRAAASSHESPSAVTSAEVRARIAAEAGAQAELMLIGALGQEQGALRDVLRQGALTEDAAEVFAQVEGVRVADRGRADTLQRRTGGAPRGHGRFGYRTVATTSAVDEGPEVVEVDVVGTVRVTSDGGDTGGTGDMPTDVVTRTIRQRVRAIRRCYERELGRNPHLEGKVTVAFTVMESGTVAHARAVENTSQSPVLGECVAQTLGRMRFHPGPEGGSVDFRYPFVFAPQR